MKKILRSLPLFLLLAFCQPAFAQTAVKRYVLVEHFTNSHCSICKSRNPTFYSTIGQYPVDIHHIAYHPPVPYQDCIFYLANKPENVARTAAYGIDGTPRVALNGSLVPPGNPLLPTATLDALLNQTSPLQLKVTEGTNGAGERTVTVDARSFGSIPSGSYHLYVAIAEQQVNKQTQNGETVHPDVFRKMLPSVSGEPFTPAPIGQTATYAYTYTLDATNWPNGEVYATAFVQNDSTGEVLNSGTRFDPFILDASEPGLQSLRAFPNPATEESHIGLPAGEQVRELLLFNAAGQRVSTSFLLQQDEVVVPVSGLATGVYLLKITGKNGAYSARILKD